MKEGDNTQLSHDRKTPWLTSVILIIPSFLVLLAGLGTAGVAFDPLGWGPRWALLAPAQGAYIAITLLDVGLGLVGLFTAIQVWQAKPQAKRNGLIIFLLMVAVGIGRMQLSRQLRGSSMPYDLIQNTLLFFLACYGLTYLPDLLSRRK